MVSTICNICIELREVANNETYLEVIYDKNKGIDNLWEILRADMDVKALVTVHKYVYSISVLSNAIVSAIHFYIYFYTRETNFLNIFIFVLSFMISTKLFCYILLILHKSHNICNIMYIRVVKNHTYYDHCIFLPYRLRALRCW